MSRFGVWLLVGSVVALGEWRYNGLPAIANRLEKAVERLESVTLTQHQEQHISVPLDRTDIEYQNYLANLRRIRELDNGLLHAGGKAGEGSVAGLTAGSDRSEVPTDTGSVQRHFGPVEPD